MGNIVIKLRRGEEINKYYTIGEKLGTGNFAIVREGIRKKDGEVFALKIIDKKNLNQEELDTMHDEVSIMKLIDHQNIVKLHEIYDSPKNLYMVLELLSGGELFESIVEKGSYSEKKASALVRDITVAIKYLHDNKIVHRDLKPENLMYAGDEKIKITDFGLAKCLKEEHASMTTACGTPGYVAPEILKKEPYGKQVDLWSIGVILYILLCGFPPFYDNNAAALYSQIKKGQFDFPDPYWTEISDQAKDLITKLLTVDPRKRYSSDQVLAHPWIAQASGVSDKPFPEDFAKRLIKFNARRKIRRGIQMVMAVNRLTRVFMLRMEAEVESNKSRSSTAAAAAAHSSSSSSVARHGGGGKGSSSSRRTNHNR